jgi:2-polyprenyl-3-methyl-5-hydroxy-6-metoxy-1,4-benzoquinol methylase
MNQDKLGESMGNSEKFWDKAAKGFTDHEKHNQLSENKDFITTLKYLDIDDTVLDYGCATGIISNAIADKVEEIHAIDISSKMIEIAKIKASELQIDNIQYAHATIFDERYQKESFNVIIAFRILHLLEDTPAVMLRINELLKPGGVFISVTTCMGSYKVFLSIIMSLLKKVGRVPHVNWFKLSDLQRVITDGGLQIIEYEKMDDKVPNYCIVARKL